MEVTNTSYDPDHTDKQDHLCFHPQHGRKHQGGHGGIKHRLWSRPHGSSVSILLASVQALDNELDGVRACISFQRDIRNCNVLCFTETWLNPGIPDSSIQPGGGHCVPVHVHQPAGLPGQTPLKNMKASSDGEEDDDDDDDFDEVPEKEGYEPHIPEHLRVEYGLDPSPSTSTAPVTKKPPVKRPAAPPPRPSSSSSRRLKQLIEEEQDPTCAAATMRLLRQNLPLPAGSSSSSGPSSSQSSSDQKAVDAPVVPFGLDLYYWGQEQPNAGKIIKSASQHQFWVHAEVEEEVENKELLAESRSRYISFPGSFTPVSHYCRAPLGNGKLCQRQDRHKCPFHGQIIPRDQEGRPCRQEDRLREEQEERRKREEQPDWRDAELMRDIEAATGENLGSDRLGKKGKGKKKKYPNLSDLKQSANTSRSRLEKKVFNKSTMRRVAQVMSKADSRKHDKFSNQFNYALN